MTAKWDVFSPSLPDGLWHPLLSVLTWTGTHKKLCQAAVIPSCWADKITFIYLFIFFRRVTLSEKTKKQHGLSQQLYIFSLKPLKLVFFTDLLWIVWLIHCGGCLETQRCVYRVKWHNVEVPFSPEIPSQTVQLLSCQMTARWTNDLHLTLLSYAVSQDRASIGDKINYTSW